MLGRFPARAGAECPAMGSKNAQKRKSSRFMGGVGGGVPREIREAAALPIYPEQRAADKTVPPAKPKRGPAGGAPQEDRCGRSSSTALNPNFGSKGVHQRKHPLLEQAVKLDVKQH